MKINLHRTEVLLVRRKLSKDLGKVFLGYDYILQKEQVCSLEVLIDLSPVSRVALMDVAFVRLQLVCQIHQIGQ